MAMPREQIKVGQAPIPNAYLTASPSPQAYGAGVGETVADVGLAVYTRQVREANTTAFIEADEQMSTAQTELQVRISEMKGKDAMGAPDFLQAEWKKARDGIEKGLTNDQQRLAFDRAANTRYGQLDRITQFHVSAEKEHYQDGATTAHLNASLDEARLNASDPESVEMAKARQEGVTKDWAIRKGLGGYVSVPGQDRMVWKGSPEYDQKWASILSNTNKEVINGLLYNGQDLSAQAYYDTHKKDFVATDRDGVEKVLEEGSTRGAAMRNREKIASRGIDYAEAMAEVSSITDPKVQAATRAEVKQYYADQAFYNKQQLDLRYEASANLVDRAALASKGRVIDPRTVIPPETWTTLSLAEKTALQAYAGSMAKPEDRPNDDRKWLDFLELSPEQVAGLSKRDYDLKYRAYFDNATRHRADAQWNATRAAVDKDGMKDPKVSATQTFTDQVKDAYRLSGLVDPHKPMTKYSDDEVTMLAKFERESTKRVEEFELSHKKKATATERAAIIDEVKDEAIKRVWVPGRFFGHTEKPLILLREDERGQAIVPLDKIPASDLAALKNYMLSNGATATPDKLRRAYAQFLLGNRAGIDVIMREK